jgi:hypothetical protein
MKNHEKRIEATYLSYCSPQAAYEWLYERRILDHYGYCASFDKALEYILLKRNEPLIDLGIANYGHSNRGIQTVFKRGDVGVKCAALGNPHVGRVKGCNLNGLNGVDRFVISAVMFGNNAEQEALIKNPNLSERVIEDLLKRKGLFDSISDNKYIQYIKWLGQNPRMQLTYENTGQIVDIYDIFAEPRHNEIIDFAWELAEILPATQNYALALYNLLLGTHIGYFTYKDYPSLIKRWRIEDGAKSGEPTNYPSYYLRTRIADQAEPNDKLLNSLDFAERESFYRRFSPYDYKKWPSFIQKDGEQAFDSIVLNDNLWRSGEHRKKLEEIAFEKLPDSHRSISRIGSFKSIEKDRRDKHPSWFLEEDLEWGNSTEAIVRRLEKNLDKVSSEVAAVENSLEYNIKQLNSSCERIKSETNNIKDSLSFFDSNLSESIRKSREDLINLIELNKPIPCSCKPAPVWPWIIAIFLLITLLIKQNSVPN